MRRTVMMISMLPLKLCQTWSPHCNWSIIKGSGIAMAFIVVDSFTEFPINCYLCGESFRRPRDLSDHERVRHPRGFQCGCGRNYETTYQLRKHSFRKGCFIYTLYSWASRRQARSSSNRNSEIRTGFVLEDVPPPSHHGIGSTGSHVFQEREAEVDSYEGGKCSSCLIDKV